MRRTLGLAARAGEASARSKNRITRFMAGLSLLFRVRLRLAVHSPELDEQGQEADNRQDRFGLVPESFAADLLPRFQQKLSRCGTVGAFRFAGRAFACARGGGMSGI